VVPRPPSSDRPTRWRSARCLPSAPSRPVADGRSRSANPATRAAPSTSACHGRSDTAHRAVAESVPTSSAGGRVRPGSTAQGAVLRLRGLYLGRFATPHRYPAARSARSETGRPSRLWISGQLSPAARRRSISAFSVSVQRCACGLTRPQHDAPPGGSKRPRCRSADRRR
jgi:hypothetical protein